MRQKSATDYSPPSGVVRLHAATVVVLGCAFQGRQCETKEEAEDTEQKKYPCKALEGLIRPKVASKGTSQGLARPYKA